MRGMLERGITDTSATKATDATKAPKALPLQLLAPAGGPEQLLAALHFGANEVYLAAKKWGMRARSKNFTTDELAWAVDTAHKAGVKVHLTLNTLMHEEDFTDLPQFLRSIDELGVDAAIVADLGVMSLVRTHAPHVELHVSTQASVTNAFAAIQYARLGATRVVLAREMSVKEIARLRHELNEQGYEQLELEAFVHGSMCMAVSGRCLLSSAINGRERGANAGACTQPCRWGWTLHEASDPQSRSFPLEEDERGSYILSSNDLCMLEHLDELAQAGVCAVKIEGRAKGAYYTACVTNAYRHVIDGEPAAAWLRELDAVSHRPYSTGFYYGNPTQNPGHAEYTRDRLMIASVEQSKQVGPQDFLVEVRCRNKARVGSLLQVLSPAYPIRESQLVGLEFHDAAMHAWVPTDEMSRAMGLYRLHVPFATEPHDLICLAASEALSGLATSRSTPALTSAPGTVTSNTAAAPTSAKKAGEPPC